MKIFVACEFSGAVRDAFIRAGHDAISCDLLPCDSNLGDHIQGDVIEHLDNHYERYDLMIAHPPCTYLTNSGVCWLHKQPDRWKKMEDGANFFKKLMSYDINKIAIENPIMHKYAREIIGRGQDQLIQPYMFGHMEQKATCLWLKNLPKLKETDNVKDEMMKLPKNVRQRIHYASPGKERWKLRSITFRGIADAMAKQWGQL